MGSEPRLDSLTAIIPLVASMGSPDKARKASVSGS